MYNSQLVLALLNPIPIAASPNIYAIAVHCSLIVVLWGPRSALQRQPF